jgi:hypothetical protein
MTHKAKLKKKERKTTASGADGRGYGKRRRDGWEEAPSWVARLGRSRGQSCETARPKRSRESAQPCFRPFIPILNYQSHNLATKQQIVIKVQPLADGSSLSSFHDLFQNPPRVQSGVDPLIASPQTCVPTTAPLSSPIPCPLMIIIINAPFQSKTPHLSRRASSLHNVSLSTVVWRSR